MSLVTNVMLTFSPLEGLDTFTRLQALLIDHRIGELGDLTEDWTNVAERGARWGGTKHPEVRLYGAAYNYLDLPAFMDLVLSALWNEPDNIQLFVQCQEDQKFTVYEIAGGRWVALIRPKG